MPESFVSVLKRFDCYCSSRPEGDACLDTGYYSPFLRAHGYGSLHGTCRLYGNSRIISKC